MRIYSFVFIRRYWRKLFVTSSMGHYSNHSSSNTNNNHSSSHSHGTGRPRSAEDEVIYTHTANKSTTTRIHTCTSVR